MWLFSKGGLKTEMETNFLAGPVAIGPIARSNDF